MAKTGKRRSPSQIARDRRKMADLYLQGWLQCDIAERLGLSAPTVSNDLRSLQSEWRKSALVDFNKAKANELAKIDRLEREYWEAWQRSVQDAETTRQEGDPRSKPTKVVKTYKGQCGNPQFLAGVQWCIERRCKLLGIDAAQKESMLNIDVTKLTIEQLERIANGEEPISVLASQSAS